MPLKSILFLSAILASAVPVRAQPALTSSAPAANAVVAKPAQIALGFSEAVELRAVTVELTMTSMPGMAMHSPMRMGGYQLGISPDHKTVMLKLKSPLPTGGYSLAWKVTGNAGSPLSGTLPFTAQ